MPVTLSVLGMRPANMPRTPPEDERALACADPGVTAALPCDGVVAADAGSICSAGLGRGGASPPGTPLGRCSKGPSGSPSASPASPSRGLNAREKLVPAWRSQEDMVDASLAAVWWGRMPGGEKGGEARRVSSGARATSHRGAGDHPCGALPTRAGRRHGGFDRDDVSRGAGTRVVARPRGDGRARARRPLARARRPATRPTVVATVLLNFHRGRHPPPAGTPPDARPPRRRPRAPRDPPPAPRVPPEIDDAELLAGDVTVLWLFALTQKIASVAVSSTFPGWLAPVSVQPASLAGFIGESAWLIATWTVVSALSGAYRLRATGAASEEGEMRAAVAGAAAAWLAWCLPAAAGLAWFQTSTGLRPSFPVGHAGHGVGRDDIVARVRQGDRADGVVERGTGTRRGEDDVWAFLFASLAGAAAVAGTGAAWEFYRAGLDDGSGGVIF